MDSSTLNHLPKSAEPVVEERPDDGFWKDKCQYLEGLRDRLTFECDQLRKELEKATREVPRLEAELAGCGRQLGEVTRIAREQRERADALTTENAALKEGLQRWESAAYIGHPNPCNLGPLCPYCEIDRLLSQFRWTPVSERMPTEDSHEDHLVLAVSVRDTSLPYTIERLSKLIPNFWTHYIPVNRFPLPEASPPETEEQESDGFDLWWSSRNAKDVLRDEIHRNAAREAWQAAKSTGGQA